MPSQFRRSSFILITLENLDANPSSHEVTLPSWVLTSVTSGQHVLVDVSELEKLRNVPESDWVTQGYLESLGFSSERVQELTSLGVLLSNQEDSPEHKRLLNREELLVASHWPPCAAIYHLLNQYHESQNSSGNRVVETSRSELEADLRARKFIEGLEPPPPAFYRHPQARCLVDLPLSLPDSAIVRTFLRRRTCRSFDQSAQISLSNFSALLRLSFGPWEIRTLAERVQLLMKTSPSGGSLHPIEAFPLLLKCEERSSGLYHYQCDRHGLSLLREVNEPEARRLAVYFAQGQTFVGECSAILILVARFDRNFWKYRNRENSYAVVQQDAGHLSQSFQILATSIELAAFYTAAIHGEAIAEALSLRYPAEAPIGLLGVGKPSGNTSPAAEFQTPFDPASQRDG
jgi:putative peptide maturation dehydrogenase